MPTKSTASSTAIQVRVMAALCGSGFLKAGTPLAMASVPVSATEPAANARSSSRMVTVASGLGWPGTGFGGALCSPRMTMRKTPTPIISSAEPTNR